MKYGPMAILLILVIALSSNVCAISWSSRVDTNLSHWSIYRQSSNISFDLSGSVEGNVSAVDVSPVESRSRILRPYQAYYAEVAANDVRLRQRTSSLEGSYKSADEIKMQSVIYPDEIEITIVKQAGSDLYTIEYKNEIWPVFIKASRTLDYSGRQINDRDFQGNNGDFVGANFLYNRELSKEQKSVIWLKRMNATVLAVNNSIPMAQFNSQDYTDSILLAEFKPTKYLGYKIEANTTGIADLGYKLRDFQYDVKHQNYPAIIEGEERYWGTYDLHRRIEMKSEFENSNETDDEADSWLPCCYAGWNDMMYFDKNGFGTDAKGVFDCTCYREITKA